MKEIHIHAFKSRLKMNECTSNYRDGDDLNSSSPFYVPPAERAVEKEVEFTWLLYEEGSAGKEISVIIKGQLKGIETQEPLTAGIKKAMKAGYTPERSVEYNRFDVLTVEDEQGVHPWSEWEGFRRFSKESQEEAGLMLTTAIETVGWEDAFEREIKALREQWAQSAEAAPVKKMAYKS